MKRKSIIVFLVITFCFALLSCSNQSTPSTPSEDETTYKIEIGVITDSTYKAAMKEILNWEEPSYSNVYLLRLYLYNNTISDHAVETGITLKDIKDFMLSKGFSNYETENEIKLLKENGNDIAFFETVYGNDKKAWIYITK